MSNNLPVSAKINKSGHLEIGGCDVVNLVKEFGTPLYVLDEQTIRERCRSYKAGFKSDYPNVDFIYASKALCSTAVLKIVSEEGFGLDVVSGGELYTALKAGCEPKKIFLHGNNKSEKELKEALDRGVGRIVVDSFTELEELDKLTKSGGHRADVLLRVNPGIEAHTHEYIKTGQIDSKFGIAKTDVLKAVKLIEKMKNVNFRGLHVHLGSQILKTDAFVEEIGVLIDLSSKIYNDLKIEVEEVNIGGGLGITYIDEVPPSIDAYAKDITDALKKKIAEYKIPEPKLIIEPGRSIVGNAGVTLYTVGVIKDIPGIRKYIAVDGGMGDNPRPILYQAKYDAIIGNKADKEKKDKVTIAGRYCESGDVLIKDIMIQKPDISDILVILCTGAYCYSMSSNYNRVGRPAMVLVADGNASLIVKRESYEDMVRNDIIV